MVKVMNSSESSMPDNCQIIIFGRLFKQGLSSVVSGSRYVNIETIGQDCLEFSTTRKSHRIVAPQNCKVAWSLDSKIVRKILKIKGIDWNNQCFILRQGNQMWFLMGYKVLEIEIV